MGFARILKDQTGKPSGYRECDGEVAYMPKQQSYEHIFRQVKIDVATMVVLDHDFIKDKQCVYRKGILLRGIEAKDFRILNDVYIGNHQVIYTPYGNAKIAHPASFEVLDDGKGSHGPAGYGRDEEFLYYFTCSTETRHAIRIKACKDPQVFVILADDYAKDDRHVYHQQTIVPKADPRSFVVLGNGYACDDRWVFYRGKPLTADRASFRVSADDDRYLGHGTTIDSYE